LNILTPNLLCSIVRALFGVGFGYEKMRGCLWVRVCLTNI